MNRNIIAGFRKAIQFAAWGTVGGAIGALLSEPVSIMGEQSGFGSLTESMIRVGIWFGIIGASIAVALLVASYQYLKRGLQLGKAFREGLWVGFLAGSIAGAIAQYTYQSVGPTEFLRVICWGIAGGLLGLGLSFRIPNLGQMRGMGGGMGGGLLGGGLFVLLAVLSGGSETTARLSGNAAIGFCIGLMIVLVETAFREAWLEIRYTPRESRTVSLGSQPVSIGSDPNLCTVYVRNVPPVALRYQLTQGQIICEDVLSGMTRSLQPGQQQAIGNITVVVCAAAPSPRLTSRPTDISPQPSSRTVSPPQSQFYLHVKRQVIPMTDGTCLSAREIPGLEPQGTDRVVAQVNHNPQEPTVLGLKNCSHRGWIATLATGEQRQVESGRSIKLANGTKINFGSVEGEIRQ